MKSTLKPWDKIEAKFIKRYGNDQVRLAELRARYDEMELLENEVFSLVKEFEKSTGVKVPANLTILDLE
jgi:hypothetical protein